jgi:hypothetical protein
MDKPDRDAYTERIVVMEGNSFKRDAIFDCEEQAKNDRRPITWMKRKEQGNL